MFPIKSFIPFNVWYTIAHASAKMKMSAHWCSNDEWHMNDWSVQVGAAYKHLKWWKPTWDFPPQLQPAADWLVHQAEVVCTKTVYLGSYTICVYCIATQCTCLFCPTWQFCIFDMLWTKTWSICPCMESMALFWALSKTCKFKPMQSMSKNISKMIGNKHYPNVTIQQ